MRIDIVDTFDFTGVDYAALFAASRATAFQHGLWLDTFYRHMPKARGAEPLIAVFRDGSGGLAGVVPMITRRKSGLRLIDFTDLGVTDYAAPVLSPALEGQLKSDETLGRRFRRALPAHDILRIRPVRAEHRDMWKPLIGGSEHQLDFGAFATSLGTDYPAWRKTHLDRSLARQMDRKRRKLQREHAMQLQRLQYPAEIEAAMSELARLRAGRFDNDPIQQEHALAFYTQVAADGAAAGFAETFALTSDRGTIGHVFGVTHAGRFHYLLIGCDYDSWGKFSPGLLMYDGIIEDWMGRGGSVFDFTIGGEDFKKKFGAEPEAMSVCLARGSLVGGVAKAVMPQKLMGAGAKAQGEAA